MMLKFDFRQKEQFVSFNGKQYIIVRFRNHPNKRFHLYERVGTRLMLLSDVEAEIIKEFFNLLEKGDLHPKCLIKNYRF